MKRLYYLFLLTLGIFIFNGAQAQDTLPKFSLKNAGNNRIIIGWTNPFTEMNQISIQRSFDSTKNYKTILSVADPKAVHNGFVDTQAPNDHMFYRIFYVVGDGMFFFTAAKRPFLDTAMGVGRNGNRFLGDTNIKTGNQLMRRPDFVPSFYVYSKNDGNIFINLPDADKRDYSIKFFEENGNYLFEIKGIKETALTLDKANFYHVGWYKFELYNNEKLVERHQFYIGKNF